MEFFKNIASAVLLGVFVVIVGRDLSLGWLVVASVLLTLGVSLRTDLGPNRRKITRRRPPRPPGPSDFVLRVGPIDMPRKNYDD